MEFRTELDEYREKHRKRVDEWVWRVHANLENSPPITPELQIQLNLILSSAMKCAYDLGLKREGQREPTQIPDGFKECSDCRCEYSENWTDCPQCSPSAERSQR